MWRGDEGKSDNVCVWQGEKVARKGDDWGMRRAGGWSMMCVYSIARM